MKTCLTLHITGEFFLSHLTTHAIDRKNRDTKMKYNANKQTK